MQMFQSNLLARRALLIPLLLFAGCQISQQQEIELGQELHPQFEQQFGGLYPDEQVQQYVSGVGNSLVSYAGRQDLQWQFRVLDSEQINAFALPGGYVYITSGLLYELENEAQLAAILGHEIGHVVERHSVRQLQRAQGAQFIPVIAGVFVGSEAADVAGMATQLGLMSYGRGQEREADYSGLTYMTRAGYNPQGMVEAMQIMRAAGGDRSPPEFLSTHPDPGNRIEYLNARIDTNYADSAQAGIVGEDTFRERVLDRGPRTAGERRPPRSE